MIMQLDVIQDSADTSIMERYIESNTPVVVRGIPFDESQWQPEALKNRIGDLTAQVYDSLFDLENIVELEEYMDEYFGTDGPYQEDMPYVRWYNKLKDVDFAWGDEAFERLQPIWQQPLCMPGNGLVVPPCGADSIKNPVYDPFPYRAVQVAARGARTRLHRDPFCSDAVVSQFYGAKEAVLYHPDRTEELSRSSDGNSFGGFVDVREGEISKVSHEPDFVGTLLAGDMIYIPHGWLHDVLVVEDSVSITWNFVHERGANAYRNYLQADPESDSEFEVLQYFHDLCGVDKASPKQMLAHLG